MERQGKKVLVHLPNLIPKASSPLQRVEKDGRKVIKWKSQGTFYLEAPGAGFITQS